MARTAANIGLPSQQRWPPAGWYLATCTSADDWKSPNKGTRAVMLAWVTPDGEYNWDDPIFVTAKALKRLNLVAQRVCGLPKETPIADDDDAAAGELARYIMANATGRMAHVQIVVEQEEYMVTEGPEVGRKKIRDRHRVSFAGYESYESTPGGSSPINDDDPPPVDKNEETQNDEPHIATGDEIPF